MFESGSVFYTAWSGSGSRKFFSSGSGLRSNFFCLEIPLSIDLNLFLYLLLLERYLVRTIHYSEHISTENLNLQHIPQQVQQFLLQSWSCGTSLGLSWLVRSTSVTMQMLRRWWFLMDVHSSITSENRFPASKSALSFFLVSLCSLKILQPEGTCSQLLTNASEI